ncbi:MAG: OmpA family protein [Desulfobacteraceae bacterium]|nr:OmpA family protein [Desulfobacteraceae bacterium]
MFFVVCVLFFVTVGCAPTTHFGVPNKALTAPAEFEQTEAAIASAERSEGAKYCPEKIAEANALGKKAAEIYWACHTSEAMVLLAEASKLAKEAESCKPSPQPRVEEKVIILASEPRVEEKVIALASEPKVIILAFEDVHFDYDNSTLKPEAKTILKRSIQILKDSPKTKIRIAGYTSAFGTKEYNKKLSERRAKAVYDYITEEGLIPPEKLTTIGYGEMRPAMYEPIPKNIYSTEAKANMRAAFEIIVK